MDKAIELNETTPNMMLYKVGRLIEKMKIKPETQEKYQIMIDLTESFINRFPERVWPRSYEVDFGRYLAIGNLEKACFALRRAYQFEPELNDPQRWREYVRQYDKARNGTQEPAPECSLDLGR